MFQEANPARSFSILPSKVWSIHSSPNLKGINTSRHQRSSSRRPQTGEQGCRLHHVSSGCKECLKNARSAFYASECRFELSVHGVLGFECSTPLTVDLNGYLNRVQQNLLRYSRVPVNPIMRLAMPIPRRHVRKHPAKM